MNNITYILSAILGLGTASGYAYYEYSTYNSQNGTELTVGLDVTDSEVEFPTSDFIMETTGLDENIYSSAVIRFLLINDKETTSEITFKVDKVFSWTTDKRARRKEIFEFRQSVKNVLMDITTSNRDLDHSAIYSSVNDAVENLSESKRKKILIIASNLYEHTEQYSVYQKKELVAEKFNAKIYAEGLKKIKTPANATDLEMIFYISPETRTESIYQTSAISAYRMLYPDANIIIKTIN